MDANEVISFFEREEVSRPQNSFTFDNPHTCRHCETVYIDLSAKCFNCSVSRSDRICQCDRSIDYSNKSGVISYSAKLDHNLAAAIDASTSGCLFYEEILKRAATKLRKDSNNWQEAYVIDDMIANLSFELSASDSEHDPNATCTLSLYLMMRGIAYESYPDLFCGWTNVTDPAFQYVKSRPYEQDVTSSTSWNFARKCFRTCTETHSQCSPGESTPPEGTDNVPSRLVDTCSTLGLEHVQVVEVKDLDANHQSSVSIAGFMALSYCWGGDQPVKLSKTTHTALKSGIVVAGLPQTLQDTVCVARAMGIRYLWIDCLCIIQDDEDDKAHEISRMAEYYGRAKVTLCAASAPRCTDGFLEKRKSEFEAGPIRVSLRAQDGRHMGYIYLLKESEPPPEPTATRAWTLQETLLSQRMLIFATRQLYWTCSTSFAGCGGEVVDLVDRVAFSEPSLVKDIYPLSILRFHPVSGIWRIIVQQYTTRRLGFGNDKLPAISALAAKMVEMHSLRPKGEEKFEYVAGLLHDAARPAVMISQLLWQSSGADNKHTSIYRAPSWSWASIDGPVEIDKLPEPQDALAVIESCKVDLALPSAPYGRVTGGCLILRSRSRSINDAVKFAHSVLWS